MTDLRAELYPYFRFLKDPTITDLSMQVKSLGGRHYDTRTNNCTGSHASSAKKTIRTMTDKILGREIVELPPFTKKNDLILFNQATEILYQAVEQRFRELVTEAFKNDDPRKKMQYSIVALLRLRQ
ncbi:hypothetical protein ACHAPC_003613 [Botrytis cinerea]